MGILLEANEIRVEFGTLVAVDDVSFKLAGGELLGLVGPNGAGKTTLLRVLAGLHAPTRGEARILGKPVLGEDEIVRQHVGFAPDAPPAYEDLTIHKFLRFIARAYMLDRDTAAERIDFWLEQLWLEKRRHSVIKTLSRGMRQRVTLARAFLSQPHVILLDEPLAGLDPAGRVELRRVLNMLRDQGRAMIVSSHILADLEDVATHIAILEHGSILRLSTTDAMSQPQDARQTYRVTLIEGAEDCAAQLANVDGVEEVSADGRHVAFEYSADERDAAALLKQLLALDMSITAFGAVKTTLEDAYIRAGIQQVD